MLFFPWSSSRYPSSELSATVRAMQKGEGGKRTQVKRDTDEKDNGKSALKAMSANMLTYNTCSMQQSDSLTSVSQRKMLL